MDGAKEVARGLVVACGYGSVLLELGKEVLDHMPRLVQGFVVFARLLVGAARWNHHRLARLEQRVNHPGLGIVGLVGNHGLSLAARQQRIGAFKIMGLSGREMKADRISQRIRGGVNLGAQASTAASNRLAAPFFAPALCWCARTMVESIMPHSLSASWASASHTRSHTPDWLQRE